MMLADDEARAIHAAAGLLDLAGLGDTAPGTRVQCLLAVEHLRLAGADASRSVATAGDTPAQLIRTALTHLAALPLDVFADQDILAAATAARTALARAEDP